MRKKMLANTDYKTYNHQNYFKAFILIFCLKKLHNVALK